MKKLFISKSRLFVNIDDILHNNETNYSFIIFNELSLFHKRFAVVTDRLII